MVCLHKRTKCTALGTRCILAGMQVLNAGQETPFNFKGKLSPPESVDLKRNTCNTHQISAKSCKAVQAYLGTSIATRRLGSPCAPLPGLSLRVERQAQAVERLIQHMHAQGVPLGKEAAVDVHRPAGPVNVFEVLMQLRSRVACEGLHSRHVPM